MFARVLKGRGSVRDGASEGFSLAVLTGSADAVVAGDGVDGGIVGGVDLAFSQPSDLPPRWQRGGYSPNDQFLG